MLVLSRKPAEWIECKVGDVVIRFLVMERRGDRTKVGIDAPPEVLITRGELLDDGGEGEAGEEK